MANLHFHLCTPCRTQKGLYMSLFRKSQEMSKTSGIGDWHRPSPDVALVGEDHQPVGQWDIKRH